MTRSLQIWVTFFSTEICAQDSGYFESVLRDSLSVAVLKHMGLLIILQLPYRHLK